MKRIQLIDNFSKIASLNNSTNKTTSKEVSKNIDDNLQNIKNLKKLFLISPDLSQQNQTSQTDNQLNIKTINKKILKNFSSTTNKFYHSSLSSLSYSKVNNERKKINRDLSNPNKEKIIILKFKKNKIDDKAFHSLHAVRSKNLLKIKNAKKIKKSFSNNDVSYAKYMNRKKFKLTHLRNIGRNISYFSSNAISNDLMNNYENIIINKNVKENEKKSDDNHLNQKIAKNKNILKYYSFNDIINGLTRNINVVNTSTSKELQLKLLRKIDELIKNPSLSNITKEENKESDKNDITHTNNNTNKNLNKNETKEKENNLTTNRINLREFINQIYIRNNSIEKNENLKKKLFINKEEEIDKNVLIEDLKFLGNANKLNWNLISEGDKRKGEEIWKKLINAKKDVGISCKINNEENKNYMKKIPKIKTPRANIKHIVFMSDDKKTSNNSRRTIILKPRRKLEPVKFNNSSFIGANNNSKIGTKINFNNDKIYNSVANNSNYNSPIEPKTIFSERKIKPRYSFIKANNKILSNFKRNEIKNNEENRPEKIKSKQNLDELLWDNESNLDIISEEGKSNKINTIDKEVESCHNENEEDEDYKIDNKEILNELNLNLKQNELLNNTNFSENAIQNHYISKNILSENNKIEHEENLEENIQKEEDEKNQNEEEEKKNDNDNNKEKNEEKKEEGKEKENENEEDDLEEARKRYEKSKKLYLEEKYNRDLLLEKLKAKKRKPKQKKTIYEFIKELSNSKISSSISYLNNSKKRKYFKNINSIQDINKRKMELLFKFKHDLEFKLINGDIKSLEKLDFKDFMNKINSTVLNNLDEQGINAYLDELEEFFNSFESDIHKMEKLKKDEERINVFRTNLVDNIDFTEKLRENTGKIFSNVIDFNLINHINELSLYGKNDKESIEQKNS